MLDKEKVSARARELATDIGANAPEPFEPGDLSDLDSFAVVQLALAVEEEFDVRILEEMTSFEGRTFDDFAEMIVRSAANAPSRTAS